MRHLALCVGFFACGVAPVSGDADEIIGDPNAPFPDLSETMRPADWNAHSPYSFRLSQAYPATLPVHDDLPWLGIDYVSDPGGYVLALREYCFKGFIHPDAPDMDFRSELNDEQEWYHVPWLHHGGRAREWVHGLTRERDVDPFRLSDKQTQKVQGYGLAMYNDIGGYTIGQVWKNHSAPDASKARFVDGAVVFKLLFSTATDEEAPWLAGSVTWTASVNSEANTWSKRVLSPLRLVQMDIAAKDSRAASGWVYTTLVFDSTQPIDLERGAFGQLVPVGLAYGNDVAETILSEQIPEPAARTLGRGDRMNGPGDNPRSSCLSCHQTAQWHGASETELSEMAPPEGATEEEAARWFRTLKDGEAFDPGKVSLGTSLQLQISLANFEQVRKKQAKNVPPANDPRTGDGTTP